jgi:hypothetical protein
MIRLLKIVFVLNLIASAVPAAVAEIVDRIVATVNGQIILQSDWEDALKYQAFVDARAFDQLSPEDRKAALDRLIDQELLREQMHATDFQHATPREIAERIQEIRKQYPDAVTPEGWQATLARYGFTEETLEQHVALQTDLLRLIDARLRPNITIDSKSIESYYDQEFVPQLHQSGGEAAPLSEVTPQIKELLTQEKMNELLIAWLQTLRSGSEIRTEPFAREPYGEAR